jgi:hypothetical protein
MLQSFFEQNLDIYTRRSRLSPALITALPITLTALMFFPNEYALLGVFVSLLVYCGVTVLLAQVGRDMGKQKEEALFESWGGKPTTRLLRHRQTSNLLVLTQQHRKLQAMLPNLSLPTALEESDSLSWADKTYEACAAYLRNQTRDREKFNLIFEENCNYGFRRNLWGMKAISILLTLLGIMLSTTLIVLHLLWWKTSVPTFVIVCSAANLTLLLLWVFLFTPTWVRIAANAYAERLLEACDRL